MPGTAITSQIEYYLGLVLKHRWLLIVPLCIAMVVGLFLSVKLTRTYEATTMILVQPQRVPSDYVRAVVSTDLKGRINTISQQILSRSNLEKVIGQFDLFSNSKPNGEFLEDIVNKLRGNIKINVSKSKSRRQDADAFSITFRWYDPEIVMKVTNALAGSFIEENLKVREAQAVGTSDFLANQLVTTRSRLEELEHKIQEYRHEHMGELPEQLDANLRILERLQTQLSEQEKSLRDEKSRLSAVEGQIERNRTILSENQGAVSEEGEVLNLAQLKAQLNTMKSNYTDRHPDVIRLKAKIADLEANYKNGQLPIAQGPRPADKMDPALRMVSNTVTELARQRLESRGGIRNIEIDIANIKNQIQEYLVRVERTPQREQGLLTLNRDYDNIKESYNSLLNRKLESEISVNMEKKQKGEQFHIVDYATRPNKPTSPNIKQMFLLSVLAGLGLGSGLIFLIDFTNTSLKDPKAYESELGLAVLASIPKLHSPRDKMWQWVNNVVSAVGIVVAIGLAGVFGLLIVRGVDPMLEIASQYINI